MYSSVTTTALDASPPGQRHQLRLTVSPMCYSTEAYSIQARSTFVPDSPLCTVQLLRDRLMVFFVIRRYGLWIHACCEGTVLAVVLRSEWHWPGIWWGPVRSEHIGIATPKFLGGPNLRPLPPPLLSSPPLLPFFLLPLPLPSNSPPSPLTYSRPQIQPEGLGSAVN